MRETAQGLDEFDQRRWASLAVVDLILLATSALDEEGRKEKLPHVGRHHGRPTRSPQVVACREIDTAWRLPRRQWPSATLARVIVVAMMRRLR